MEIKSFKKILNMAWTRETCVPSLRDKWSKENKELGQCAITSLLVNDYYGGKIMRCMTSTCSHYYNLIDDELVDLTVEQFMGEIPLYDGGQERTREYLLSNADTKTRYLMLLKNVKSILDNKLISDTVEVEEIIEDFAKRRKRIERMKRYYDYE